MVNNEYVNKVIYGDKTLIDITDTNFDVEKLPLGSVAYAASGERVVGKAIVHNVYSDTTANWDSKVTYVPEDGDIIIYIDKSTIEDGGSVKNVPGIKIGDGNAYCVDLPFVADDIAKDLYDHISNTSIHVSSSDRTFWDSKLNCNLNGEILEFNRN